MTELKKNKAIIVYILIVALSGLGLGLSDVLLSNYFRDAYEVDAFQRGLIEIPREMPGVLAMFALSGLAFLGDKKLAMIAHALLCVGMLALALLSPTFNVMLIFLFVFSSGVHMFIPLYDSLGMSLASNTDYGKVLGKFNSIRMAFTLIAGLVAFYGFRVGFFSFTTPVILNFLIAAILFAIIFWLIFYLKRLVGDSHPTKAHFVFRKEYIKFYILASLFGGRKQIIFVYGPWVLIELLDFGADHMSLLMIAGSVIGIFFIPMLGRWVDKFGAPKVMVLEVLLFFVIYLGYGFVSAGLHGGWLVGATAVVALAVGVNILDRLVLSFNMVRTIYLRSIAKKTDDVTPTLATGMALDHIFSIIGSIICGWIWWEFGPQYVFVFSGVLAVAHLIVALQVKREG